ncbi:hydrogenobyrinic acid a,c-diamide synthase (glutamine-hydrolysing) /cobyrinate a,c-diamide synthase [Paraburkholderia sp. BL6665CI2N2]|uniref:cobyrinate a,c-diamide synthase n=1 Tax=Paraburkholderia sp. BL6665CI2N2 TaxID=1938806 RepID=UPI001066EBC1|nr:cobyrinate a,c-diamide synthase [Paraburkholderia sp. BL6665CI2N2]TDY22209.1 hydrogenobyrinic acid a,c-diamide synthase (glutamine-hydrolysing) /cobyrinate a,c-diamide synthase [Paraburkholderia sp. BL6665CI2N2]
MAACPALFISAPASGQGKTTITAGLARYHRRLGRRVRVFKIGPDFLDPMILARASGAPVLSLDLWMVGEAACRTLLAQAAAEADLILIEGVMGLFDGTPSSADLATTFGVPVLAVISAKAMAQTFGAVAFGLAQFRPQVPFYGVLANRVGSARHAQMLEEALPPDLRWCGHIAASDEIALPDRHLGLHQAEEIDDLDARLDHAADTLGHTALAELPPPVEFGTPTPETLPRLLDGKTIAIARDAAFSFIYPANVALLEALGAQVAFFSPLADEALPEHTDAVYLPGGYPELHAATLASNTHSAASIHAHAAAGKPLVAECGGMLYLLDQLTDTHGVTTPMLGLLPGHATMQTRFTALGMQQIDSLHGPMTGHTFHYSKLNTSLTPLRSATRPQGDAPGEALYRAGSIVATYMHAYWPSNPAFTAALFHGEAF